MSGPEVVAEVNKLSAETWNSKALNLLRLLDDNGYKDLYTHDHTGDKLTLLFFTRNIDNSITVIKEFVVDLSSMPTERDIFNAIEDWFGGYTKDRSYETEGDGDTP